MPMCSEHPDWNAVGTCSKCGRQVCNMCRSILNRNLYCKSCASKISGISSQQVGYSKPANKQEFVKRYRRKIGRTPYSRRVYRPTYSAPPVRSRRRTKSVFRTFGCLIGVIFAIGFLVAGFFGILFLYFPNSSISTSLFGGGSSTSMGAAAPTSSPTSAWIGPNGEHERENVMCGANCYFAGGDGHRIELLNNPQAHNPSWGELRTFLANDKTDEMEYNYPTFVCADFAERLHNNAEEAGLRAAYVGIQLSGYTDPYGYGIPSNSGHALNAFDTTDYGLVYVDCTGLPGNIGSPCSSDKEVNIQIGKEYIPESIFPCVGWSSTWYSGGVVEEIEVTQW